MNDTFRTFEAGDQLLLTDTPQSGTPSSKPMTEAGAAALEALLQDGGGGTVDNASVNAAIATDPAASRTAMGIDLSTSGGISKVPQTDASGNIYTGPLDNRSSGSYLNSAFSSVGNIYIPDQQGIIWRDPATGDVTGSLRHWRGHDSVYGETILGSAWRIALIPSGPIQIGKNDAGRYIRKVHLVSGAASNSYPATEYMPSGALAFETSVWNGANDQNNLIFQAHALDTSGTNSALRLWDNATVYLEDGGGGVDTVGKGDVQGNMIAEFHDDGIWSNGTAPAFATLADDATTVTQACIKHRTVQSGKITLTGDRSLAITNLLAGMRGVIYVTQDGTGSWELTPSGGSVLDLTTGSGNVTDRVAWEYDGVFVNFSVTKAVQQEVVVVDADAAAFIAATSSLEPYEKAAIVELVDALKANSEELWDIGVAIYPFVGGISADHAINLKSPGTYNITWVNDNAARHTATGVNGNIASSFRGNTNLAPSAMGAPAIGSLSLALYSRTATPATDSFFISSHQNQRYTNIHNRMLPSQFIAVDGMNANASVSPQISTGGSSKGTIVASRTATNAMFMRFNAIESAVVTFTATATSTFAFNLFCQNYENSYLNYSDIELGFAWIGFGMTSAQCQALQTIMENFQTKLGRQN